MIRSLTASIGGIDSASPHKAINSPFNSSVKIVPGMWFIKRRKEATVSQGGYSRRGFAEGVPSRR